MDEENGVLPIEDPDWGFFHDDVIVENGFIIWQNTKRMPTLEEAASYDSTWLADLTQRKLIQKRADALVKPQKPADEQQKTPTIKKVRSRG